MQSGESGLNEQRNLVEVSDLEGRAFRRYSDGSIKAATSQGWQHFADYPTFRSYHYRRADERNLMKPKSFVQRLIERIQP